MSDRDPPRLSEPGSGSPDGLRALFEAGTRDVPTKAELRSLARRLGPILGAGAGSTAATLAKVGAVLGVVLGGAVGLSSLAGRGVPPQAPVPAAALALPQPTVPPLESAPAGSAPALEPGPSSPPSGTQARTPRAAESEASLLERARGALQANPARALSLAAEHRAKFPAGVLAQEREVIVIEALRRLGRTDEARAHTQDFAKAYPGSAHRHKLDAGDPE